MVLDKVGEVISTIKTAKRVDDVVCALHSLVIHLFPLDSSLIAGGLDELYRDRVSTAKIPSATERDESLQSFYEGAAFPTLARVLLLDVASDWLAFFPFSAKEHVYDAFFVNGLASVVVQTLVPYLQHSGTDGFDANAIVSNTERLLVLCLLDNDGVLKMAQEFSCSHQYEDSGIARVQPVISRVAQIVASVPDKARPRASSLLSSHFFFKQITVQLLCGLQERNSILLDEEHTFNKSNLDGTLLFVGETFSRICRRGSSDVLLVEVVAQVLGHIRRSLASSIDSVTTDLFESNPSSQFWFRMMEAIKDHYAIERMSEQLLHQLASEQVTDVEAYWTLWLLFNRILKVQSSARSMFIDKFLLWKVFPVRCLRWIIQFAILQCAPVDNSLTKSHETQCLLYTVERLVTVWSKRDFVQSTPMEQQAYVTAAIGLCMEKMSKDELDKSKDAMHSILHGVSCRLENPSPFVKKMASSIAYVFSKIIDHKNPLYLDDSCHGDVIDWEFGSAKPEKGAFSNSSYMEKNILETKTLTISEPEYDLDSTRNDGMLKNTKGEKKLSHYKLADPDEIIDPATLNYESTSDKDDVDDDASENSDASSDSSLVPYDLTDDDSDLKRKFLNLVDVVGALRKSDDAEGVERALDVTERLVRASPDELTYVAGELARALVQVRCSDVAVEGEEESAEEKRQRALVALLVTSPFKSLDSLNKLLYSPNVDISQRIMILDVMTEAAQELAVTKTIKPKHQTRALISTISENQPWFLPSSIGTVGAGPWKDVSETGTPLNYSNRYERDLPLKPGHVRKGKSRQWSLRSTNTQENHMELSHNKFPLYAAAFMLPAMEGFDKKRHGVDLLGRDFLVLGKLIYMLGVCMRCMSMHPEASALAPSLLDMLRLREICHHKEVYVRRAVLFAVSCILQSLHPSYVATALSEGNLEVSGGLEWVRSWALEVVDSDVDKDCYMLAMWCLQLHAEMALQASRALESAQNTLKSKNIDLPSILPTGTIKIPYSNVKY